MEIDVDTWIRRFFIGIATIIGLLILLLILGTAVGRALLVFVIVLLAIIFGLGWAGDVLYEAYEEYK